MPIKYYNKPKVVSDRYDPFNTGKEEDTDVTEETSSAGDTDAPGAPMPGEAFSSGADAILHFKGRKGGKKQAKK